jgi:putative SOS response-associated peptidase YedK
MTDVAKAFDLVEVPELFPRFNIAPTQDVAIVRLGEDERRHLSMVHWGLISSRAKSTRTPLPHL